VVGVIGKTIRLKAVKLKACKLFTIGPVSVYS
jgi:hypothetical protein